MAHLATTIGDGAGIVGNLLYLKFDEQSKWCWYWFALAAFLLALLSKSAVVMLPVALLGCIWWLRGRIGWNDFFYSVPFFAFSVFLGLVSIWFEHHRAMAGSIFRTSGFFERLATAGWVPWFYLSKAILPIKLTMVYPLWKVDALRWISWIPCVILIAAFAVFWWRRNSWGRPLLFGLGYFVVMLLPVLGFFDQGFYGYSLVSDHWQYYSIVSIIALIVAGAEFICRRVADQGWSVAVVASVIVASALGAATLRRNWIFAENLTLWQDNMQKNPHSWVVHSNLGLALQNAGDVPAAIAEYKQTLEINPNSGVTCNNLGLCLWHEGNLQEAIGCFERALQIQPVNVAAQSNLGLVLLQMNKLQEAIGHFEEAARIRPDVPQLQLDLGNALVKANRLKEARWHFEQALKLDPNFAEAQRALARLSVYQ